MQGHLFVMIALARVKRKNRSEATGMDGEESSWAIKRALLQNLMLCSRTLLP